MTSTNTSKKALVLTVGTGNVNDVERTLLGPMLLSIRDGKWERIVLLPSHETQEAAQVLSKRLQEESYSNTAIETLPKQGQENDADACFGHFDSALARLVKKGFKPNDIVVDFTRGTKAMSAALVLAAIGRDIPILRYVHSEQCGDDRGMVIPGTEKIGEIQTTLATARRRLDQAKNFTRQGDFGAAVELLPDLDGPLAGLFPEKLRTEAQALRAAARIYAAWNRLNYKTALKEMKQLGPTAAKAGEFAPTPAMRTWLTRLAKKPDQANHTAMAAYLRALACDLLANAERRLRDGHFEDALIRAYRVLELIGQIRLFDQGYDSAALPSDDKTIEALRKKLRKKKSNNFSTDGKTGKLQAPRDLTARLLNDLGDPLAKRLLNFAEQGKVKTKSRNHSILIHGFAATAPAEKDPLCEVLANLESLLNEDDPKAGERLKVARSLSFS